MNYIIKIRLFAIIIIAISNMGSSCNDKKKELAIADNKKEYKEKMILSHQAFLGKEKRKIQNFIDSLKLPFEKTGTGLRYYIIEENPKGKAIESGDMVSLTYLLTSIEGDTLYKSPRGMSQEFKVDYDNVENGLHEGIKHLKTGEKAILILPAHLAHGVTGDQAAIGTQTTLVYQLMLLGKR